MWLVLTLLLALSLGHEVEPGCDDWKPDPSSSSSVCCTNCKPGNHLVSRCGSDLRTLCAPCVNGTFNTERNTFSHCKTCTQCIAPQRLKKPCTARTDTVCECVEGFQCGDHTCSYCIKTCGKGEEPTGNRICQPCPAGTFNDQLHQHCVKWSSSCPSPDQQIVAAGTAVSDIICADVKPNTSVPTEIPSKTDSKDQQRSVKTDSKDPYAGMALIAAIICACLIISSAMLLCVALNFKKEKTEKMPRTPEETPAAGQRLVPEPEQCSFCFPQEERGSNSSLLLDDKPFELVV